MTKSLTGNCCGGTGDIIVNTGAGTATTIEGGTAGDVLYQATTGDTQFVSGTQNNLLQSNGSLPPTFVNAPTLKKLTLTNTSTPISVAQEITHAGNDAAIRVTTTSNVCGLRIDIPSGQTFNTLLRQASVNQRNDIMFSQAGTKTTTIGQGAFSGNFITTSDRDIEMSPGSGYGFRVVGLENAAYLSTNSTGVLVKQTSFPNASNISGGTAGDLVVQSGPNSTTFIPDGNTNTVLAGNGAGLSPSYKNNPLLKH
jgi:hypothetical protein